MSKNFSKRFNIHNTYIHKNQLERSKGAFQKKSLFKKPPQKHTICLNEVAEDIPGKSNNKRKAKEWEESRGCGRNTAL